MREKKRDQQGDRRIPDTQKYKPVEVEELKKAEREIINQVQARAFIKELKSLGSRRAGKYRKEMSK